MKTKKKKASSFARAQRAYEKTRVRGMSIQDKVFGLEAWARQVVADIHDIRERLHKLEHVPPVENERFMEMIAREMVKQNFAKTKERP